MAYRIPSFTEYALLNRWSLDFLSPSQFQKRRVDSVGESALRTLKEAKVNPYSNLKNSSYVYYANKFFISTPLKIAYIAAVTFTVSRLGVAVNGLLTITSYLRYKTTSSYHADEAWEKTKNYAFAFFADLASAVAGVICTKFVVECAFYTLHFCKIGSWMGKSDLTFKTRAVYLLLALAGMIGGAAGLIALQSPSVAPQFFARPQDRVGMYLSMIMRKELGLVNEKGSLLPFSKQDQLDFTKSSRGFQCSGWNFNTIVQLICDAEWELLETVQKCNQFLPQKIPCQYPFDGEKIARQIEEQIKVSVSQSSGRALMGGAPVALYPLIDQLKSLNTKIRVLREIFIKAQKLTVEDSIPVDFIKGFFKLERFTVNFKAPASFINEWEYREQYTHVRTEIPKHSSAERPVSPESQEIRWDSFTIEIVDPSTPRPSGLVEGFRYDVGVSKWKSAQGQDIMPLRAFFGLPNSASFSEYKKQKRAYGLRIHPDKNHSPDATELFKCLNTICEVLDKEYNP